MKYLTMFSFSIPLISLMCPLPSLAQDSLRNASNAGASASIAVVLGLREVGEVAVGMSAVPMQMSAAVSGAVGAASIAAGNGSAQVKGLGTFGSLPVADETITAMSPADALKKPSR